MTRPQARYLPTDGFHEELIKRVDAYFAKTKLSRRDNPDMVFKTSVIGVGIATFYCALVLGAQNPWQAMVFCAGLAVSIGGLGFSVAHDGNHGAYSARSWLNRIMGTGYDAIGASSYIWRWKHNVLHHSYPNITALDEDINRQPLFRLAPDQVRKPAHRFQFVYAWVLYAFLVMRWQFFADFRDLHAGKTGKHAFTRPRGSELWLFWLGKLGFVSWAFVFPGFFHSLWKVGACYLVTSMILSLIMSTVFQVAHCFEDAGTAKLDPRTRMIDREWARHQIESSADYCRDNRVLSWYVGGLNFQTEHHLFPKICHIHYPAISKIVEGACREYGVRYTAFKTLGAAIASHETWLYRMGRES